MPEDLEAIRYALRLARRHGFSQVELQFGETEFEAKLTGNGMPPSAAAVSGVAELNGEVDLREPGLACIEAHCVGYFQASGAPLEPGRIVRVGEVVASIAALGLPSDVESKCDGEVLEVLVQPGDAVEFGQPIARIKEAL